MSGISAFLGKAYLDYALSGGNPAISNRWTGLAVGTPNSTGGSEMGTLTGYSRLTASFVAAASPAGSASLGVAQTFGPFSSVGSALGFGIWDGSPVGSSDLLWFGTLQTARTFAIGDQLVFSPGAINISIA